MASPFLSHLGISVFEQARSPAGDTFPQAFNVNNKLLWQQAVAEYTPGHSAMEDWGLAIKHYIELCESAGLFPFQPAHVSKNDQIHYFLSACRLNINRFLNRSKLLSELRIRRTNHRVVMTDTGFHLDVSAWVYLKDPTFPQFLTRMPYPRFNVARQEDGRYIKKLGPGLEMYAYNEGVRMDQRWHIGYTIDCNVFPEVPAVGAPSKAELERFILDVLWMPVLRESRPLGLQYRLI